MPLKQLEQKLLRELERIKQDEERLNELKNWYTREAHLDNENNLSAMTRMLLTCTQMKYYYSAALWEVRHKIRMEDTVPSHLPKEADNLENHVLLNEDDKKQYIGTPSLKVLISQFKRVQLSSTLLEEMEMLHL
jgi:hypothetical protein